MSEPAHICATCAHARWPRPDPDAHGHCELVTDMSVFPNAITFGGPYCIWVDDDRRNCPTWKPIESEEVTNE